MVDELNMSILRRTDGIGGGGLRDDRNARRKPCSSVTLFTNPVRNVPGSNPGRMPVRNQNVERSHVASIVFLFHAVCFLMKEVLFIQNDTVLTKRSLKIAT